MSNSKIVQLGRYSFDRSIMIGSGSFGKVYCGNDSKTNQPVCIKVFQKKQEFGENVLETVNQKELDFTKQMINEQHENLVKIIDIFDDDQLEEAYIIMELCDQNMEEYVEKKKMLNREEIIDFISQVTNGYYRLEERNIVHRCIIPSNILIKKENGKVIYKIADFCYAKLLEENSLLKTKNIGTPYYSAPEIMNSSNFYTNKCDIFSFGIIIFELLVGNQAFRTRYNREKLKDQNFEDLFVEKLKEVDEWLKKLLSNMMIYDWTKRIGWKELKVIIDLNMIDQFKGILGRIKQDNLFLGQFKDEQNQLPIKIFQKSDRGNEREFQLIQPYKIFNSTNIIKITEIINKPDQPLIYVIMESCASDLHSLMDTDTLTSEEIFNLIEQIVNGYNAISLQQKKIFSISLSNILVKYERDQKVYKISDYEYYQIKDKNSNQKIEQPIATVHQLAWIIYQLITKEKISYQTFQQEIKYQQKINSVLSQLDPNLQNLMWHGIYNQIEWGTIQVQLQNLKQQKRIIHPNIQQFAQSKFQTQAQFTNQLQQFPMKIFPQQVKLQFQPQSNQNIPQMQTIVQSVRIQNQLVNSPPQNFPAQMFSENNTSFEKFNQLPQNPNLSQGQQKLSESPRKGNSPFNLQPILNSNLNYQFQQQRTILPIKAINSQTFKK